MTRRLGAALALTFTGCNQATPSAPAPSVAPIAAAPSPSSSPRSRAPEPLPPCSRDVRSLGLEGSTPEGLESRFGPPSTREPFRAIERQGEFYAPIENLYPSTDPKNHDVPIEEYTWKSGPCTLTVWFHRPRGEWRAIDDVYWHEQIDF
jgi:hypothetical protein